MTYYCLFVFLLRQKKESWIEKLFSVIVITNIVCISNKRWYNTAELVETIMRADEIFLFIPKPKVADATKDITMQYVTDNMWS